MRLEDETRAIRKMTEIPSRPIPGTWRRKRYHPIFNNISKFRRRATSRMLQYYGETRMTKLSSRPASLCHPSESATLANTNLRDMRPNVMVPVCGSFIFFSATWCQRKWVYTPYGVQCSSTKLPRWENPTKWGVSPPFHHWDGGEDNMPSSCRRILWSRKYIR